MMQHRPLLYIETSVFGFYYDPEPRNASRRAAVVALFQQIGQGLLDAAVSQVTIRELSRTPEPGRSELLTLAGRLIQLRPPEDEVERLAGCYLAQRVVPASFADDARHVACATLTKADVLVSCNLRHLVNEWAERNIAAVNLHEGYQMLRIRTPEEVLKYED